MSTTNKKRTKRTTKKKRGRVAGKETPQSVEMRTRGFISVPEAARRMHANHGKVYRACEAGAIASTTVGGMLYVEWKSFERYAGILAGALDKPPAVEGGES